RNPNPTSLGKRRSVLATHLRDRRTSRARNVAVAPHPILPQRTCWTERSGEPTPTTGVAESTAQSDPARESISLTIDPVRASTVRVRRWIVGAMALTNLGPESIGRASI